MNTKTLISLSLLVGIGAALHVIIPGFFLGMKPDMMLTMAFLAIILFPDKKSVFLVAITSGLISGLTTTFPGGFIPNIIDKCVTCFIFYLLLIGIRKISKSLVSIGILTVIGTLISGFVFLGSAYFLFGLPGAFLGLFAAVVLPATVLNTAAIIIIYPIVGGIVKKTSIAAHV